MCEYCGCRAIPLIGRFSAEHYRIVDLSAELKQAIAEGGDVLAAARALDGVLFPHTEAEEVGLFVEMRTDEAYTRTVDALCGEHEQLDAQLTRIANGAHEEYDAFELALRRHIDREENGLFPAAAVSLDGPQWERIVAATPDAATQP